MSKNKDDTDWASETWVQFEGYPAIRDNPDETVDVDPIIWVGEANIRPPFTAPHSGINIEIHYHERTSTIYRKIDIDVPLEDAERIGLLILAEVETQRNKRNKRNELDQLTNNS